jgi:CBS domain-containing protein
MLNVRNIMTTSVQTINRDTVICEVDSVFNIHKISGVPLVDDSGRLVGFVSKSDISRFDATGDDPNYARVYEIASPKVITIEPSESIAVAAQKMIHEHVHHLVVVEGGKMVGVLSTFDFVRIVAEIPMGNQISNADVNSTDDQED